MGKVTLTCSDFRRIGAWGGCCTSCHEDAAMGFDDMDQEPSQRRGRFTLPRTAAHICCATQREVEGDRSKYAAALWAKRAAARRSEGGGRP